MIKLFQRQVWDNIAPEWHKFRIGMQADHTLKFLKKQTGNILDLGSGSGRYLTKIKNSKMFLVDFSKQMIALARKKAAQEHIEADFQVAELTKLPYPDDFFDAAIASSSLHCIPGKENREKTVRELYRVLKPGARAEISVWNKDSDRFKNSEKEKLISWRDKGKRYYYLFEPDEIYNLFKNKGFKLTKKEPPRRMIVFEVEKI